MRIESKGAWLLLAGCFFCRSADAHDAGDQPSSNELSVGASFVHYQVRAVGQQASGWLAGPTFQGFVGRDYASWYRGGLELDVSYLGGPMNGAMTGGLDIDHPESLQITALWANRFELWTTKKSRNRLELHAGVGPSVIGFSERGKVVGDATAFCVSAQGGLSLLVNRGESTAAPGTLHVSGLGVLSDGVDVASTSGVRTGFVTWGGQLLLGITM